MFIYEERNLDTVKSNKMPHDAIVVEQWTVIEVSYCPICLEFALGMSYHL